MIDSKHQAVVLLVLGSRGYPGDRGPLDFVMDFSLKTEPWMGGEAHAGILQGARNLEAAVLPCLIEQLALHPTYSLLLVGYSLGKQTNAETSEQTPPSRLPPGTKVRTISFGCPPVFRSPELPSMENILDVLHHNDAISGISLRNLSQLHQRKRGLAKMGLHRRTLVRMALGKKVKTISDGEEDCNSSTDEEDVADGLEESNEDESMDEVDEAKMNEKAKKASISELMLESLSLNTAIAAGPAAMLSTQGGHNEEVIAEKLKVDRKSSNSLQDVLRSDNLLQSVSVLRSEKVTPALWSRVEEALNDLPSSPYPETGKLGRRLVVVKRKGGVRSGRMFTGPEQTQHFTKQVRLKNHMFGHHMPASYTDVFTGP